MANTRFLPQPLTLQSAVVGQNTSHDFLHRVFFVCVASPEQSIGVFDSGYLYIANIGNYGSNALAIAAGLTTGTVYRNGDNLSIVH